MSIEYQLLEEIDVPPQSPNSILNKQKPNTSTNENGVDCVDSFVSENKSFNNKTAFLSQTNNKFDDDNVNKSSSSIVLYTINNDPFDVKWSVEILQKSSARKINNIN